MAYGNSVPPLFYVRNMFFLGFWYSLFPISVAWFEKSQCRIWIVHFGTDGRASE
jgi:hypothetical protein